LFHFINILLYSELPRYPNKNSHNETNQKGSCAQYSLSGAPLRGNTFGRSRTLSEHVAQLRFGKINWKSVYCIHSCVNPRLQSRTIEGDLHFFLELIERYRSGAQRIGRHVARECILCGPQCFLGIFK